MESSSYGVMDILLGVVSLGMVHLVLNFNWIKQCFPDEKIGLIWDHAAAHKSNEEVEHANAIGITIGFVPPGLTSIIQVCDQIANKPLKQAFKRMYCAHKLRIDPGSGGKYTVHRDYVLTWIEDATKEFNETKGDVVGMAFEKFGQDHRALNTEKLNRHLISLQENSIYGALLDNQTACNLDD
ncbi:hypothetical protein AC1031_010249 [Aphanomyces cochlioides]|nr:hypothetical protein AC1031_010249 [Aphanomyces cochlioides]